MSFNPRPSSFMGVLAWAATAARLKGFAFCPLAGERVGGCAVEWLSRSFDAMSPTHKFDVEVTDLSTGVHTTFSVIRKQRTYRATGKTTVRYNTPVGNFGTFDEVNAALVAEALAAARAEGEGEVEVAEEVQEAEAQVDVLAAPVRHEQPQQRHFAQATAEQPRAERLLRLRHLAMVSELSAEPCTPERAARARRADRIAAAYRAARSRGWGEGLLLDNALGAGAGRSVQVEQQQAQREVELHLPPSVAMLVEYRFTRQDGALILPEQRVRLDDGMFELIGEFALKHGLNVEGQALFEHPEGPTAQVEQQQAQAAAPVLAAFEPECDRCGALLDDLGSCPRCAPLRISAPTTDLAGLLRGNGWGEERRELVTEVADGKVTLRAVPGGVRLEVERAGGAVAAVVLETGARLDLVTDLMQLGRAEAWGGQ